MTQRKQAAGTGRIRAAWSAMLGALGVLLGLTPHVLHHVGFLAGTALVAGVGGTAVFGAIGLVASIPFLLRLRQRFKSWWAPAIGLAVFIVMFSISAFVIGPALSAAEVASGPPNR
jgi:phosphotransferase system  glucose/maltose/N-acetylglucosamine-specific IIC component